MQIEKIVLASHGTPGARAAERTAFELARNQGAAIAHLYVVPEFWAGMRGDDWLNNAVTQATFGDYLENELAAEASEEIQRLRRQAESLEIPFTSRAMFGEPTHCLQRMCETEQPDLAVMGTPRPRGISGYRSRIKLDRLMQELPVPLMIVPHDPADHDRAE